MAKYKVGDIIKCSVCGITEYGFFVNIDKEYVGLCHISEVSNDFVKLKFDTFEKEKPPKPL